MSDELIKTYQKIIWQHSEALSIGTSLGDLERLHELLAYALSKDYLSTEEVSSFTGKEMNDLDDAENDRLTRLKSTVSPVLSGDKMPEDPIPSHMAMWPVDGHGYPQEPLPESSNWFSSRKATKIFDGRNQDIRIGLFEATDVDDTVATSFLSYLSPRYLIPQSTPDVGLGLLSALVGIVLFFMCIASLLETGIFIAEARKEVASAKGDFQEGLKSHVAKRCQIDKLQTIGGLCSEGKLTNGGEVFANCLVKIAPTDSVDFAALSPACGEVWKEALSYTDVSNGEARKKQETAWENLSSFFIDIATPIGRSGATLSESREVSLVSFQILLSLSMLVFLLGVGKARTGMWKGVFVSEQNRVSLSRFQVTTWTVILLSAFAAYSAFNVGVMGGIWQSIVPVDASRTDDTLFPSLPAWAWAVLGITISSSLASSLIKGKKPEGWDEYFTELKKTVPSSGIRLKPLARKATPRSASFWDLVFGEDMRRPDENNRLYIDPTRVQLVFLTIILIVVYTAWIGISISGISYEDILARFSEAEPVLASFPAPGAAFTGLLALTHGVYIAGKWPLANPNP